MSYGITVHFLNLVLFRRFNISQSFFTSQFYFRNSNFDHSLAKILSLHHVVESLEGVFKSFGHSFLVLELTLAYPSQILVDPFEPSIPPAIHQKSLHLQLLEHYRRLENRRFRQFVVVQRRNRAANRDSAVKVHLIHHGSGCVAAHLRTRDSRMKDF